MGAPERQATSPSPVASTVTLPRSANSAMPMIPSGAVSNTMTTRERLCSWIIRTATTASTKIGRPAITELEPLADSSTEPPVAIR